MFRHSPEAPIVDLPIVAVIDLEVVVVIRFVAMESIPERSVAQEVWWKKGEIKEGWRDVLKGYQRHDLGREGGQDEGRSPGPGSPGEV